MKFFLCKTKSYNDVLMDDVKYKGFHYIDIEYFIQHCEHTTHLPLSRTYTYLYYSFGLLYHTANK